jgi:hypothetical protein
MPDDRRERSLWRSSGVGGLLLTGEPERTLSLIHKDNLFTASRHEEGALSGAEEYDKSGTGKQAFEFLNDLRVIFGEHRAQVQQELLPFNAGENRG